MIAPITCFDSGSPDRAGSANRATKSVRIELKARNNRVLWLMEHEGIASVSELCRLMGKPKRQVVVGAIINLKMRYPSMKPRHSLRRKRIGPIDYC